MAKLDILGFNVHSLSGKEIVVCFQVSPSSDTDTIEISPEVHGIKSISSIFGVVITDNTDPTGDDDFGQPFIQVQVTLNPAKDVITLKSYSWLGSAATDFTDAKVQFTVIGLQ